MKGIVAFVVLFCLLASNPAFGQTQTDKQKEAAKGQTMFYIGLGIAATGLTPLFMGTSKGLAIGAPIVGGGTALAIYAYKKKQKAQQTVSIVPVRKGVAVAYTRTW